MCSGTETTKQSSLAMTENSPSYSGYVNLLQKEMEVCSILKSKTEVTFFFFIAKTKSLDNVTPMLCSTSVLRGKLFVV